jgi:hypothetical protein
LTGRCSSAADTSHGSACARLLDGRILLSAIRSLVVLCLLAGACTSASLLPPAGAQDRPFEIRSVPLALRSDQPAVNTVGRLVWRGGIAMTANARAFGGWSDLRVSPDGRTLTSISDEGAWLTATIDYDAKGDLMGLSKPAIGPLHGLDGQPLADKAWSDAEGMARLPDGSWLVSFERHHRIWRYPRLDATPGVFPTPAEFARQPNNGGIEALTALADGRIVAISEEWRLRPGAVVGWIALPTSSGA